MSSPRSSVDFLLGLAARTPLLTPVQEVTLGRRIRAWQDWPDGPDLAPAAVKRAGRRALDQFVTANIRLAYRVARRYEGRGVPLEDLLQSTIEGLMLAARRFQPDLGYRSSSYTVWYLRLAAQQAVAHHGNGIRLPQSVAALMGRAAAIQRRVQAEGRRDLPFDELAELCGVSSEKLARTMEMAETARVSSLDAMTSSDDGSSSLDHIGVIDPEPDTAALEERQLLREALHSIDDLQQRAVIEILYLGEERVSQARCGRMLNISRQAVQRHEREGMEFLRSLHAHARRTPELAVA